MCISDIIDLISSVSVFTASILGIWGVNAWRKETRFKRKYELAEKVLANAYEAVEVINIIRFPASKSDEGQSRKPNENETPCQTKILNNLYVVKERFLKNNDSFKRLFSLRFQLKAVFGDELEQSVNTILRMPNKIFLAVDQYADTVKNPSSYTDVEKSKLYQEYSKSVFGNLTKKEEDPIYNEMKEALKDLEKECRKYLK